MKKNGIIKHYRDGEHGLKTYAWARPSKMDLILEAFGSEWVNAELGIMNINQTISLSHLFDKKGEGRERHEAYKSWKTEAFKKAWVKIKGTEPDEYMLEGYE